MPRPKKQVLKKRSDGRYACRYKTQWFYSTDPDECLKLREEYKEAEKRGRVSSYFVSEYAKLWVDRTYPNANTKTLESVKRHVKTLTNAIGELPVSSVKPSDIKDIYATYYKTCSQEYIKHAKQAFCGVFDAAVADGIITFNPARDRTAKPHKGTVGGHRSITPQEREWMLTYCKDHRAYPLAMAMLYAGLRPQEAKALVIERDVDFENETITVRQTAHTDPNNGQKYVISDKGKTGRANRTIPLLPPLKTALQGRTGMLITDAKGKQVSRNAWQSAWNSYRASMEEAINGLPHRWYGRTNEHKAIIERGKKLPPWIEFNVAPYDLRVSFCTMCRNLKPPVEMHTVIKWMGHADATMILKVYDDLPDDREQAEAQRLRENLTTDLTTKPRL